MMSLLVGFKEYLYAFLIGAIMFFVGWFKLRGMKIDELEQKVDDAEQKDEVQDFEADNRVAKVKVEATDVKDIYPDGTYTL